MPMRELVAASARDQIIKPVASQDRDSSWNAAGRSLCYWPFFDRLWMMSL